MKKSGSIFRGIGRFFDKLIIMPITRLIYNVGKKAKKPKKTIETMLTKPTTLLFISLALAIFIFIVVDRKMFTFSSQSAEVLKDQTVNVIYNEEQYFV